ncbi:MAG: hypothetical protein P8K08_20105 [Fuerstiella sp.]|jgi:hypothetical protein|nr:hypothetical protein [Fuerstiella sp.]
MSYDVELTKGITEQYPGHRYAVDLWEFTAIADDAAECLSNYEGDDLVLFNVESLSGAAAESLSKYKGQLECQNRYGHVDLQTNPVDAKQR